MEPFTIIAISLLVFLLNNYGRSVITFTADKVQENLRYIFKGRNIAILGEKSSGKPPSSTFFSTGSLSR